MKVIPYLSLRGRSVLRKAYTRDEFEQIVSKIAEDSDALYLSDEDGILRNKPQLDLARRVCDEIPTIYEAGVRFGQNVIDVLVTGAERAVLGTSTLTDLEELRVAFKLSENITLKADYRDGILASDPSHGGRAFLALSRDVLDLGVSDIIVPKEAAGEASLAKKELGFTLGVFAPVAEKSRMAELGVDYMITQDIGSVGGDE